MPTIVYIPGIFDLLHVGHLRVLKNAKALGDVLIVGVPSDSVVTMDKGESPIIDLGQRIEMLESLRFVDVVIPYTRLEFLSHLKMINPDILAVGGTWGKEKRHTDAEKYMMDIGSRVVKIPYTQGISTSIIKERARK